ncbi:Hypothetical protein GSB_151602 [Giardia duodenalis]|uniref:Uncharacterized protein n=1 Tax=Giardia intestinalis TaxID=5741 RepID=V6U5H3_GIAIN|nr:Hypothetical protein GSB_151602 [Giardia intestinalis]
MCGLRQTGACGEGEARLVLAQTRGTCPGCHTARALDHDMNCPKTAWTRTTRHDMIVCVCTSACRGSSTRSWRSRHTAISTTRARSRTPGHRQV